VPGMPDNSDAVVYIDKNSRQDVSSAHDTHHSGSGESPFHTSRSAGSPGIQRRISQQRSGTA
jgi:hypothetical protein